MIVHRNAGAVSIRGWVCVLAAWSVSWAVLPTPATAQTLAAGSGHTVVRQSDGSVWTVGLNNNGQLGDNTTTTRKMPLQVAGLTSVAAVAAGAYHSLALTTGGTVYVWGDNASGQLGDNSTTDRRLPVALSLTAVVAIAAGEYHSLALTSSGDVYTWGRNTNGQLGNGTTVQANVPTLVLANVQSIGAGFNHSLFLNTDGTVVGSGLNTNGQLGDASVTSRSAPVAMSNVLSAIAVVGGERHSVVLLADGTVKATGYNAAGQLGDGTTTQRTAPVTTTALTGIVHVSGKANHAIARTSAGAVWGWGSNAKSQIGDGSTTNRTTAVEVLGTPAVTDLATGSEHSVAVTSAGAVWTWGASTSYQLANGTTIGRVAPDASSGDTFAWRVSTPEFDVVAGTYTSDRTVTVTTATPSATIRYTQNGSEPTETDATVASGGTIAVSSSQTLRAKAWLAGTPASAVASAGYVLKAVTPSFSPSAGTSTSPRTVAISSTTPGSEIRYTLDGSEPSQGSPLYAASFTIATTTTLRAASYKTGWDRSDTRSGTYTMNFGTLTAPTGSPGAGAYEGQVHVSLSAALGTIRYTTNNAEPTASSPVYDQPLVINTTTTLKAKAFHPDYVASSTLSHPYTLTVATPVLSLASGSYPPGETVTITSPDASATLRMTLSGVDPVATDPVVPSGATLFVGSYTLKVRAFRTGATPSAVASASYSLSAPLGPGAVSAGDQHSALATPDGRLYVWGSNASSQLGLGSGGNRLVPTLVPTLTGVTSVAAGLSHTLAATYDGKVFGWGANGSGQLGNAAVTQPAPVQLSGLTDVVQVAAGGAFSLALTSAGEVFAFGAGSSGQLGLGSSSATATPTKIPGLNDLVAISAGTHFALALTSSGQVYAWGANSSGQLGLGGQQGRYVPTLVSGLTNVVSVSAGNTHGLASTAVGSVYAWGLQSSGQLGLGGTTPSTVLTPTLVPGLGAVAVEAGGAFSMAQVSGGDLRSWGGNSSGQLGDGTTALRSSPILVGGVSDVALLSAGGFHSMAVTADGHLWTWGEGSSGQQGHGSTADKPTPSEVVAFGDLWGRTGPPLLSVAPGLYQTDQALTVTVSTPGAIVRYTTNGAWPVESDPEVAGPLTIDQSSVLRFRAWSPGRLPSSGVTATYSLQAVTPVIGPGVGTYTAPQSVSLSTTTTNAVTRYTLDGSEPTNASLAYSSPFVVSTQSTVRARTFRTGWTESATASASMSFNYGTLAMPVATPPSGTYEPNQGVSLTAEPGTQIRYTLDGSTPTSNSNPYTQPISVGVTGSRTIKARAFRTDYTPSVVMAQTYSVDTTAPPGETLESLAILPSPSLLAEGGARQFTATGIYSNGSHRDVTAMATWTSTDPTVALVTAAGRVTAMQQGPTAIEASVGSVTGSAALSVTPPRLASTGSMTTPRFGHGAALLPDGKVLLVGGQNQDVTLSSAEVFDPVTEVFAVTDSMSKDRVQFTTTPLADGRVLVIGGWVDSEYEYTASAEIYDPTSGTFGATGALVRPRGGHTAAVLHDGRVLIVGGACPTITPFEPCWEMASEIYDPVTGLFALTGELNTGRMGHTATVLDDGRVLVVGGTGPAGPTVTAEIYDPESEILGLTGSRQIGTESHTATKLLTGQVLVVGGWNTNGEPTTGMELFDPVTEAFLSAATLEGSRASHSATLLYDGTVLLAGGAGLDDIVRESAELYDPAAGPLPAGTLESRRDQHSAVELLDGRVLLSGGRTGMGTTATAEIYQATDAPPRPTSLQVTPGTVTMLVGETRSFTAVDQFGRPRSDATWDVGGSQAGVVDTIAGRPALVSVAAGSLTLTATIQGVTATAQVVIISATALPLGDSRWSVAAPAETTSQRIVHALPQGGGPAIYSIASTETQSVVRGLTVDGQQLWQLQGPKIGVAIPTAFGGLLVSVYDGCDGPDPMHGINPMVLVNLDRSGAESWRVTAAATCTNPPSVAIRHDGTVVASTAGNTAGFPPLMFIDGVTGAITSAPAVPTSTWTDVTGQVFNGNSRVGPPSIGPDGETYVEYEIRNVAYPPIVTWAELRLLKIDAEGSPETTVLSTTTENQNLFPGRVIPGGDGDFLATWTVGIAQMEALLHPYKAARPVAGGLVTFDLPIECPREWYGSQFIRRLPLNAQANPISPMLVLGSGGVAYASFDRKVTSFYLLDGALYWTFTAPPAQGATENPRPEIVGFGENSTLVVKATDEAGSERVYRLDVFGNASDDGWEASGMQYFAGEVWTAITSSTLVSRSAPPIDYSSVWSSPTQNGTGAAQAHLMVTDPRDLISHPDDIGATTIKNVFIKIKAALEGGTMSGAVGCHQWLRVPGNTGAEIIDVAFIQSNAVGHGIFNDNTIDAFTGGTPAQRPVHWAIAVNRNTTFFHARRGGISYYVPAFGGRTHAGGTLQAQATTLIHETAHLLLSLIPRDGSSTAQSHLNTLTVVKNCGEMISNLR